MKKLITGIVDFRKNVRPTVRETFAKLALGQAPDTLFVACSDSRVVPNLFASTEPGDLFVVRNVGNMIPKCGTQGTSTTDVSEAAALEFALLNLPVTDIIVCGHSECGAMNAIVRRDNLAAAPNLALWLHHADPAYNKVTGGTVLDSKLSVHNQVSQINVLQQMEHIRSYPLVRDRILAGKLRVHGWWFDIAGAEVYSYEEDLNRFVVIDETHAKKILKRLS